MNVQAQGHAITSLRGLASVVSKETVYLLFEDPTHEVRDIHLAKSTNGLSFKTLPDHINLQDYHSSNMPKLSDVRLSMRGDDFYLLAKKENSEGLTLYQSSELLHFGTVAEIPQIKETGMIAPNYKKNGKYVMFYGDKNLNIATSPDLKEWKTDHYPVLTPNHYNWEQKTDVSLHVGTVITLPTGIIIVYFLKVVTEDDTTYAVQAVMVDKQDPKKIAWQSDVIWDNSEDWAKNKTEPIGVVFFKNRLISYWNYDGRGVFSIQHSSLTNLLEKTHDNRELFLKRVDQNPIIKPSDNSWENRSTFNPGAIVEKDSVHLVYRAIGDQELSVIGYAKSDDGINIHKRLNDPVFISDVLKKAPFDSAIKYMSGGGYGGCEDPRLTRIDGRIYMTYVAYDGWSPPRVALTSIDEQDFFNHDWKWSEPVMISRPGMVNKNAVIFPEKINGKYVIMHRVFPNILIDYWDTLDFNGNQFLRGDSMIRPRKLFWDSRKIGAGPPPIKTDDGWLLIYHSVGDQDPGKYKMGAMLLDHDDPSKVIARTKRPILVPDHPHENHGHKTGVAYPCGAVHFKEKLIVYYGGADSVTLAAEAEMDSFLKELVSLKQPQMQQITLDTAN